MTLALFDCPAWQEEYVDELPPFDRACMFLIITASVLWSSSAGLNITTSLPGSCFTGT
jgi:hypothetical protein